MLTVRNVLATLALFASLTGTSFAVVTINSTRIKNESLTGKDIKDKGLGQLNFSQATFDTLDKNKGVVGNQGPQGPQGQQGLKGQKGNTGAPAPHAFSYIMLGDYQYIQSPRLNPGSDQSCTLAYNGGLGDTDLNGMCDGQYYRSWVADCNENPTKHYCNVTGNLGVAGQPMVGHYTTVLYFVSGNNGGFLTLDRPGNVIITANAVLLHRWSNSTHSRLACVPEVRLANSVDPFTQLGTPTIVSSNLDMEIKNITVTGGIHLTTPGSYDFQVSCTELDEDNASDSSIDWRFVKGNANAISTEQ